MIVMKFGGTSVQDAAAILQVAKIVSGKLQQKPVVVVSAMSKVTDGLIRIGKAAGEGQLAEALSLINQLRDRHLKTARDLLENNDQQNPPIYRLSSLQTMIRERFQELENLSR